MAEGKLRQEGLLRLEEVQEERRRPEVRRRLEVHLLPGEEGNRHLHLANTSGHGIRNTTYITTNHRRGTGPTKGGMVELLFIMVTGARIPRIQEDVLIILIMLLVHSTSLPMIERRRIMSMVKDDHIIVHTTTALIPLSTMAVVHIRDLQDLDNSTNKPALPPSRDNFAQIVALGNVLVDTNNEKKILLKRYISYNIFALITRIEIRYQDLNLDLQFLCYVCTYITFHFCSPSVRRFLILPDMLKNAPMFKNMGRSRGAANTGAAGRGKSAILRAQAARGRGGRGGGGFGDRGRGRGGPWRGRGRGE